MKGGASANVYKSFIELELYYQYYKIKYGESGLANDIHSIIKTTKKSSKYLKKVNRFYFICKNLKKGAKDTGVTLKNYIYR